MKNLLKVLPDWKSLNKETLKLYKLIGLVIIMIGCTIIFTFVPTIKIWFKILGGIITGYGTMIFLNSNHYLNQKDK